MKNKAPLVSREMLFPFILLTLCFAAWGTAANMTDPLVKVFSKIFTMSSVQSALVQFCYYGAYFCLAIPAALINKRFSYKTGVLSGLGCAAIGAFMFYPASQTMTYTFFLSALFILAGGLSILETSANPYVMSMGCQASATRRLNFAQSFNPLGTSLGVFLAATLILPQLNQATADERSKMSIEQLEQVVSAELDAVMVPYVGFACVLVLIWFAIALTKSPKQEVNVKQADELSFKATFSRLFSNKHYRFGVVAQFFNVAAQTCVWTYTIQYVMEANDVNEVSGGQILQYSMLVFLISRFVMTWLMGFIRPAVLLGLMASIAALLCAYMVVAPGPSGVYALIGISACLSLMFPTIYAIALFGLGADAKLGAAGLVMAILGGAIMPIVQAVFVDHYSAATSYLVPGCSFLVVLAYAIFDLNSKVRSLG
ncbi:MAG: L-fucose:H+ symporter permease [Alteromonadaceae bacterium]|uniref:MFS transporter n=1 Tax=Paraglaciecola chathamensis TaxID=368405 RepID=A0A8H9I7G9_9ALTE|nr:MULTISPECIES: L-fucose:H+ symporter permease [Paraglaciecola]MBN26937.1 L-fucose:H+ symporter permease [Alteromonadaceae bacterium]GGZ50077.1 MFS transporter [Paraglaciecola oceanifecundans]|tara:strand:- start:1101 stop:2381 length:1281 start_codon:yes stop_codon:yes gene_type:complete